MAQHDYWLVEQVSFTKACYGPINCLVWHDVNHAEPIYLVSNLDWAKDIMDYYNRHFSIETIFGDIKSRGFNIHKVRIGNPERLNTWSLPWLLSKTSYVPICLSSCAKTV